MAVARGENRAQWIGDPPSPLALSANLLIGTIGMLICGVQPVLLGALVAEHRLSVAGLGWATTAEFLTLGISIVVAGGLLRPHNLRLLAALAALLTGLADLAMLFQSGASIFLNRAVSGCGEGVLVWITGCMIARSPTPARWSGIFVTAQGITQLAYTTVIPLTLMATYGADGAFIGMALTAAVAFVAAAALPNNMVDLPAHDTSRLTVLLSLPSIMVLTSVFLIAAFSIGLFVYLAPLSLQAGLSSSQMGLVISIVLGSSILGSAVAALVPKLPYYPIFVACLITNVVVLAVLWAMPDFMTICVAAAVFGFMWLFFMPYQLPMAVEVDPTRQTAVVLGGAQLLGGGAGPFLCSFFVTNADARGSLLVVGACFVLAFAISTMLHFRRAVRRPAVADRASDRLALSRPIPRPPQNYTAPPRP